MVHATPDPFSPISAAPEQRRALRRGVRLKARLRGPHAPRFDIDIRDLSTTGFRAEVAFSLHIGDRVWVTLPSLSGLEAEVAWKDGFFYGFRLHQPLHPAVLDRIVTLSER